MPPSIEQLAREGCNGFINDNGRLRHEASCPVHDEETTLMEHLRANLSAEFEEVVTDASIRLLSESWSSHTGASRVEKIVETLMGSYGNTLVREAMAGIPESALPQLVYEEYENLSVIRPNVQAAYGHLTLAVLKIRFTTEMRSIISDSVRARLDAATVTVAADGAAAT